MQVGKNTTGVELPAGLRDAVNDNAAALIIVADGMARELGIVVQLNTAFGNISRSGSGPSVA